MPQHSHAWDLLLLDQNLEIKGGAARKGTEILSAVIATGCPACFIMHSANSTASAAGGKGRCAAPAIAVVVVWRGIYENFTSDA